MVDLFPASEGFELCWETFEKTDSWLVLLDVHSKSSKEELLLSGLFLEVKLDFELLLPDELGRNRDDCILRRNSPSRRLLARPGRVYMDTRQACGGLRIWGPLSI